MAPALQVQEDACLLLHPPCATLQAAAQTAPGEARIGKATAGTTQGIFRGTRQGRALPTAYGPARLYRDFPINSVRSQVVALRRPPQQQEAGLLKTPTQSTRTTTSRSAPWGPWALSWLTAERSTTWGNLLLGCRCTARQERGTGSTASLEKAPTGSLLLPATASCYRYRRKSTHKIDMNRIENLCKLLKLMKLMYFTSPPFILIFFCFLLLLLQLLLLKLEHNRAVLLTEH